MKQGLFGQFSMQQGAFRLQAELQLPAQGITGLFGPSGCGKTTLLRCLAGLSRADSGKLLVDGEIWQDDSQGVFLPTHQRQLGVVFQQAQLFPHLTVQENIHYGMRRKKKSAKQVNYDHVIAVLAISHLLNRKPENLSGGEQQRVAIARALLTDPRLLLMDEPLSALDRRGKVEIMRFLQRLHHELVIPVVYVTHSLDEITQLADTLVLMAEGKILASGPLGEMLARLDLPLAQDERAVTVVSGVASRIDERYGLTEVETPLGRLFIEAKELAANLAVKVHIHARDVSLSLEYPPASSILNIVQAQVTAFGECGITQMNVVLDAGGVPLLARITRRSCSTLGLKPGMKVYAQIKSVSLAGAHN